MKQILKTLTVFSVLMLTSCYLQAQEQGKIRVGADIGMILPANGIGLSGNLDLRYNISNRLSAGLRLGSGGMMKNMEVLMDGSGATVTVSGHKSYLATSDYYFTKQYSQFAPFVGAGAGIFKIGNVYAEMENGENVDITAGWGTKFTVGAALRGGFEFDKFRLAMDYYLIPRTSLYNILGNEIGTASNSYMNISVGFYIGGGRWGK